jgi:hypothetical protein
MISAGMGVLVLMLSVLALAVVARAEQGAGNASLQVSDAMFAAAALGVSGTLLPRLLAGFPDWGVRRGPRDGGGHRSGGAAVDEPGRERAPIVHRS